MVQYDNNRPILLVFSDDWGRHPSSCQHLVKRLLDTYTVVWVNTIGTRSLRLDWLTVRRAGEKILTWLKPNRIRSINPANSSSQTEAVPNPMVINPVMMPTFRGCVCRWINRAAVGHSVRTILRKINPADERSVYGITTLPYTADIIGHVPVTRWVYYCVDDWSEWPGMDKRTLQIMEQALAAGADGIISVSKALQQRIQQQFNRSSDLLRHGFDEMFFCERNKENGTSIKKDIRFQKSDIQDKGPVVTYWGLTDERIDPDIVVMLSETLPSCRFWFIGPVANPPKSLFDLPNVQFLGTVDYEQLPIAAEQSDVLIMPYTDSPVTRQIQPLKMLEYLATGKPVVARNLPAMNDWSACLDLADDARTFVELVKQRLESGLPDSHRQARICLHKHTWEQKAKVFEALVLGDCDLTTADNQNSR